MIINTSVLAGEEFNLLEEAHLVVEDGMIREVNEGYEAGGIDLQDYLAIPGLINGHTHVGDSFAKEAALGLSVDDAVGKNGLKWQLYKESRRESRVKAIRDSLEYMLLSGVTCFADFREFGWEGIEELEEALDDVPLKAVILGRDLPIEDVDGLGLNLHQVDQIPENREGRIIALHAGEDCEEVPKALGYDPDVIVHCTHATDEDLEEIARKRISVIVCPRANAALGVGFPRVDDMLDLGINVCIGTDNVMTNSPNMWREMEFLSKACRLPPAKALMMSTLNAAKAFRLDSGCIKEGCRADIVFLDKNAINLRDSRNPLATIVYRCEPENVRKVLIDGRFVVDGG
ncbi:MAG: amidohydrolase family protein [Candidatus Altiarchaeota archaeon]|nr:amidohydrolase family protein [Candidatus Altiarchaeota archaeon]